MTEAPAKYKCLYCQKQYTTVRARDQCLESHDIVYVPISRSDLNRLLNFIMSRNEKYLTESLTSTLFRYVRK